MVAIKMISWIKKHRTEIIVVFLVLLVATFLRFYRLADYMTFLGDEGRDVLVVKRILTEGDLPFIGPPTSVGNIYLGPLYYYMMTLPMVIFWLNPVAATGMVAGIGVATVFLIYYFARQWFGFVPAVSSAILYAISPVTITYSRSSWNPNPAPFFALLMILGLYKSHQSGDYRWFTLSGAALAAAIQMHYLALILLPVFLVLWVSELIKKESNSKNFTLGTIMAKVTFIILILPLILFDFKHNFLNFRAILTLFTQSGSSVGFNIFDSLGRIFPVFLEKLVGRLMGAEILPVTILVAVLVIVPLFLAARMKDQTVKWPFIVLGAWFLIGLFGISFYRQDIYDHYLGFLNPVPFLLIGGALSFLRGRKQVLVALVLLVLLGAVNLQRNPLLSPPGNQLVRTQEIAKYVIGQSGGKQFNFALIAKNNYDSAYQFYLEQYGAKPEVLPIVITDQLFVVCEDPVCNPIGHPKYEIAAFGWAKIESKSEVLGVKVYKLVSNPGGKPS